VSILASATTETDITVTLTLNEPGTAWCRAVRSGFSTPTVLEILETSFSSPVATASVATDVLITHYDAYAEALQLGTDYDVYCFAEDDLCFGCRVPSGISFAAVTATLTPVRTLDTTPPVLTGVKAESIARDQIQITLQVDEGALVWCAAWAGSPPSGVATDFETLIKDGAVGSCSDDQGRPCGSFWVYDLDDLEDTPLDGVVNMTDYENTSVWRYQEDVTIVLAGLEERTSYDYI
jgi:hypothetical protein